MTRERERLMAQRDRTAASEDLASGLTSDFRRSYGPKFSLFNMAR